jgi:hypothetical protein
MHKLHVWIGEILKEIGVPGCEVILGKDCGGDNSIQLFCKDWPAMATRFLLPDAAVLKDGELKGIVEIEESDIRPLALSGKVFASAFASHSSYRGTTYPVAAYAFFVQVIDTSKLSARSSKLAQCSYLRESIRDTMRRSGWNLDAETLERRPYEPVKGTIVRPGQAYSQGHDSYSQDRKNSDRRTR